MPLARSSWWAVGSLVLMLVGAFSPWAKVFVLTIDGTDDGKDGWVVVAAAAFAAVFPLIAGGVGGATAGARPEASSCAGFEPAATGCYRPRRYAEPGLT